MIENCITSEFESNIKNNNLQVCSNVSKAAKAAGRDPNEITIIAVSKTWPIEIIKPLLEMNHIDFGENRIQEAIEKWVPLKKNFSASKLHIIGSLQTNKVRDAVNIADTIHSLDREKLVKAVSQEIKCCERRPQCFIQVNTGEEYQKAGVLPEDLDSLIEISLEKYDIPLEGLMCLPPYHDDPAPHFALLKKFAERHSLKKLSMGMSADYMTAIEFGATHIRVGSAIFGNRKQNKINKKM